MRIAYLVPGNGGRFYCENCQRDAAQLAALRQAGHDVVSVPLYLPPDKSQLAGRVSPLFFGAVGFYLRETVPLLSGMPAWLRRAADSPALLGLAARQSGTTSARGQAGLTITMIRGQDPVFRSEAAAVCNWLSGQFRPDVVHISNLLLIGLAPILRDSLGAPVVITLQDEHTWIDSFWPDLAAEAWDAIRRQCAAVDRFLPVSEYYRQFMAGRLGLDAERFTVVRPGVDAVRTPLRPEPPERRIGFLSRWSEAMGFGLLVDAFIELHRSGGFDDVGLLAAGGGTGADRAHLQACRRKLRQARLEHLVEFLPDFGDNARRGFLERASVLSVPSINGEAFGSFILEALAAGVPVVQPRCGGFSELVEEFQGGLLVPPGDTVALAQALGRLLADPELRGGIGRRARELVVTGRDIGAYARDLAAAYAAVLEPRGAAPAEARG
jgi:glycosyltransferase involved in cell wall biosynthesis